MADLVEKVGSGIGRMRKAMREAGLPLPKFKFTGFFIVTFQRPSTPKATSQVELTELWEEIISEIEKNIKISRSELAKKLNISSDTIKEYIEKLKAKKVLKRIGKTSAGHWEIAKSVNL